MTTDYLADQAAIEWARAHAGSLGAVPFANALHQFLQRFADLNAAKNAKTHAAALNMTRLEPADPSLIIYRAPDGAKIFGLFESVGSKHMAPIGWTTTTIHGLGYIGLEVVPVGSIWALVEGA